MENGCAGSGCTDVLESYTYNLRLQPITINLGTSSNPSAYYCLVYNFYANSYYPNSCSPTPQNWGGDDGMLWNSYYGDNVNPSLSHTELYYYDGLKRLTTAQATGNSTYNLTFAYDRYGNMTCQTNAQTQGLCPNYSFDQTTNRINTPGFQYDAAGNLTLDNNQHAYQWDAENRPISLQGTPVTFNAFGEMASFVFPWTNVYYLYDPAGNPVGMTETGGEMWRQFIPLHGRSMVSYSVDNQEMYFLHPNLLGSVTMNTNQTGAPVGDLLIYPWGQPWTSVGDLSIWQYAQFQNDKSLIDSTPTRWDDPSMGRWLSTDPLGGDTSNPQSLNRYAYVLNSPVTLTDPSGLCPECIPNDCGDPTYISAECGGPPDCVAEGTEGCIPFPIGYPVGLPGGGGTGGGGSTTGTGGTVTATAMPPGPLNGSQFGGPPGFQSTAQVIVQIGVYASPWEIDVLSICAGTPVCQDVLLGAAAGVLIYKGVQAGISIYKAQPKGSGKEKASDAPSWAAYYPREPNEPCAVYAARILLQKYGAGDPRALRRGPVSEYSQIKKACERGGL